MFQVPLYSVLIFHILADNEGRAEEAEHHKQDQLQKQKEGKGHWKDELASDSESIVRPTTSPDSAWDMISDCRRMLTTVCEFR